MTKMPLAAAAVLLLLSSTTVLFAEGAPKSVDAIPLYKGFVLDPGRNETTRSASAADPGGSYRTYTCRTADMTDVLDWHDMTASQLVELRIGTRSRAENAGLPASMSTAPRLKKISAFLSTPGRSTARRTPA